MRLKDQEHPENLTSQYHGAQLAGAPTVNFRKIFVRKTIWDLGVSEHFVALPASPRIFEHLKNGIIAHF